MTGPRGYDVAWTWAFLLIACALIASLFLYLGRLRDTRARRRAHGPAALRRYQARQAARDITARRASGTARRDACGCTWTGPTGDIELDPCPAHVNDAGVITQLINVEERWPAQVQR